MPLSLKLKLNLLKSSNSSVDYRFLLFLILVTQGSVFLKIIGIVLISILRFNANLYVHSFGLFYLLIILYHILFGIYLLVFNSVFYFPNYLLCLAFWSICYITLSQILYFLKVNPAEGIYKTIDAFFVINIIVIAYQFVNTTLLYGSLNPYSVTNSAGDFIKSLYANSSVNFIIMSFFSIMYLQRRKWRFGLLAILFLLMATYMSGLVTFLGAMVVGIYLFSRIQIKKKALIILGVILIFLFFNYFAPGNVTYATRYIYRIIENDHDAPFKIKSFYQTFEYWTSSIGSFIFGAGGGNFSSRVAFITSGDYVGWFPDSLNYVSEEFKKYHLDIWTHDFNNPWDNRNNTANQPFSFYNQIIGEYGLIGLLFFIFLYLGYIIKKWRMLTYSKFLVIVLAGFFLLDYWFEYFSVIIIFELLLLIDIKRNSEKNITTVY